MKKSLFAIVLLAAFAYSDWSLAQSTRGSVKFENPAIGTREGTLNDLNLNEDQMNSIRKVKKAYVNRMVQRKTELAGKQIEFKQLIGDPNSSEESIRAKGREIESVNNQIIRDMINYEVEIRRILTPEQLRRWCQEQNVDKRNVKHQ
jgi:Spy/CpxP family protein refolding chaperone